MLLTRYQQKDVISGVNPALSSVLPGEALLVDNARERVRLLGSRLFGEARVPAKGECPTCWSDIWKFPQPDTALFPLCGQTATLAVKGGELKWIFETRSDRYSKDSLRQNYEELNRKVPACSGFTRFKQETLYSVQHDLKQLFLLILLSRRPL